MPFSFFFKDHNKKDATNDATKVQEIPLSQIVANRFQPRKVFSKESIQELAATIQEHGLLQPVVLREYEPQKYEIIAGERRFRAVSSLNWQTIPALVKEMDDKASASMAIIENLHREGLTAIEEAQAYQRLMELNQMTQTNLAQAIGKSQSFVANKMRLLKLAPGVQREIMNRNVSERHGRCMVSLNEEQQVQVLKEILAKHMSVKETEDFIKQLQKPSVPKKVKKVNAKVVARNSKLAVNTIKESLKMIEKTGIEVKASEEDIEGYHRIIIDIATDNKN